MAPKTPRALFEDAYIQGPEHIGEIILFLPLSSINNLQETFSLDMQYECIMKIIDKDTDKNSFNPKG